MEVTLNTIYEELLSLKKEVAALRGAVLVEVVKPSEDEVESIKKYEKRKKAGDVNFSSIEEA